jgi:hypothetical protein
MMKRITLSAIVLLGLLLASAAGVRAQTATPTSQSSKVTIINEGNVLSDSDINTIRNHAAQLPLPLVLFITNQYKGAKIDFSRKIAQYVTDNNVVIGISTYKDSSVDAHYRLLGAGPHSGVSADLLNGAQNAADSFLKATGGPQYVLAIDAAIDYLVGQLGPVSTNNPAPTAIASNNGNVNIINEGGVLSQADISDIHSLSDNYLSIPALIVVTNQYRGTLDDFKAKIGTYLTDNNFVAAISTYSDSKTDDRYIVLGAGPHSGLAQSDLDDALQGGQTEFSSDSSYSLVMASIFGSIKGSLSVPSPAASAPLLSANTWSGNPTSATSASGTSSTDSGQAYDAGQAGTSGASSSSSPGGWAIIGGIIVILLGLWFLFIFVRWIWRLSHHVPTSSGPGGTVSGGGGYYDNGPIFYPIWLGGGSYGGGGYSSGGGVSAPSAPPNTGGGSFASAIGGSGSGGAGNAASNTGGGKFESSIGSSSSSGGGSSSASGAGGGAFESSIGAAAAVGGSEVAGQVAGAAINILGGILGAVFSSGSGGSGPDF